MKSWLAQWPLSPSLWRALLIAAGVFFVLLSIRWFNINRQRRAEVPPPAYSSAPTVQCADGTRSNILTRAAQKDACAAHGGIRKLLVPPYRPGSQAAPPAPQNRDAQTTKPIATKAGKRPTSAARPTPAAR